jgi:O-antigen ligase
MIGGSLLLFLSISSPQFRDRISSAVNIQHKHHDERKLVWKANFEIFKDYPFFGIGFKNNTPHLSEYYERLGISQTTIKSHAHNQFLQILATTGIFGLLFYLAIWFRLFQMSWLSWKFLNKISIKNSKNISDNLFWKQGLVLGSIGGLVAFLIAGLSECNFDDSKANYMLSFVVAAIVWVFSDLKEKKID